MKSGDMAIIIKGTHPILGRVLCDCGIGRVVKLTTRHIENGRPFWYFEEFPCPSGLGHVQAALEKYLKPVSGIPDFEPIMTTLELQE